MRSSTGKLLRSLSKKHETTGARKRAAEEARAVWWGGAWWRIAWAFGAWTDDSLDRPSASAEWLDWLVSLLGLGLWKLRFKQGREVS